MSLDSVGLGLLQVDLVDDGNDDQVLVERQVGVSQGLGFDALDGVDHQEHPLACGQAAGDLVGEIDVPWCVDEVELVGDAVGPDVREPDHLGLDCDAPLPLQVHPVEILVAAAPLRHQPRGIEEPVGKGRFAVVDVGDDGEISDGCIHDRA